VVDEPKIELLKDFISSAIHYDKNGDDLVSTEATRNILNNTIETYERLHC